MIRAFAAFALLAAASPALAQEEPAPLGPADPEADEPFEPAGGAPPQGFDIAVSADILSEYRFRGISRSNEDPAVRAGVTVSHHSGAYAGARATSLEGVDTWRARAPGLVDQGDAQIDLFAGYRANLGRGFDLDAGLMYYWFAGAEGASDYAEPYASLSYLIGPVYATAGVKYAPEQSAIGGEDMVYLFGQAEVSVPFTPLSFAFQAGRQDWGRYGAYWNWSIGTRYSAGLVEVGIDYVDTDLRSMHGQDGGLVFSAGVRF